MRVFENLFNKIEDAYLGDEIIEILRGEPAAIKSNDWYYLFDQFSDRLTKHRNISSKNYLMLCLTANYEKTFVYLRKKGSFRYYNYHDKDECSIRTIAEWLLAHVKQIKPEDEKNIQYLSSIITTFPFWSEYKNTYDDIVSFIASFRKQRTISPIKTFLAYVDYVFLKGEEPENLDNPNKLNYYTQETISEAVSLILYIEQSIYTYTRDDAAVTDAKVMFSENFELLILSACKYKKLQDIEILIEHFDFECIQDGNALIVNDPTNNLETAIRLGFIHNSIMKGVPDEIDNKEDEISIAQVAKSIVNSKAGFEIALKQLQFGLYEKYVLQLPEAVVCNLSSSIFQSDTLLAEESDYLYGIYKEHLLVPTNNLQITENITLLDFIKMRRVFSFLFYLFYTECYRKADGDKFLIAQSLVMALRKERVKILLSSFSDIQIDEFLKAHTWDRNKSNTLDIQYHPIFPIKDLFLFPLSIIANSSSIRNLYSSESKKNNTNFMKDGSSDYLLESAQKSFEDAGFDIYKNVKFPSGDIDLIARKDGYTYLFECKNTLLPTNLFELRTTFDHISKANSQLDKALDYVKTNGLRLVNGELIDKESEILTGIIISNRMFYHWEGSKHPIRYIHELNNILNTGHIKTPTEKYIIWANESFSVKDLNVYLSPNNILIEMFHSSLAYKEIVSDYDGFDLIYKKYGVFRPAFELYLKEKSLRKAKN